MTSTAAGSFLADMPTVTSDANTASSAPKGAGNAEAPPAVVVINGFPPSHSDLEDVKDSIGGSSTGSPSGGISGSPSSSIFTIGPSPALAAAASGSSTVINKLLVKASAAASSPVVAGKGAIVASSDTSQIIVVSESDGSLDSNSNGNAVTAAGAPINIVGGTAYVQAYYTVGETMYAATPPFYTPGTTPVTYSNEATNSTTAPHIITAGDDNTYIIQGVETEAPSQHTPSRHSPQTDNTVYVVENSPSSTPASANGATSSSANGTSNGSRSATTLDADAQANIAHATRVSPATVQWLLHNYEQAEGVSLPRSTLYNHYLHHCADHKLDPVNSASFGKLIRSVFTGLKTRRLGTRGNSKYHYYGIRVKPNSVLNNLSEDGSTLIVRQQDGSGERKTNYGQQTSEGSQNQDVQMSSQQMTQGKPTTASSSSGKDACETQGQASADASPQTIQNQNYLGDFDRAVPVIPDINLNGLPLPPGVTRQHVENFQSLYQDHCSSFLDAVYSLRFHLVETIWRRFWAIGNNNNNVIDKNASGDTSDDEDGDLVMKLSNNVLQALCTFPPILEFMKTVDYELYQNVVEVLIPDVLRSIPSSLTQSIRNFAKSLEGWLSMSLIGYPQDIVVTKVGAVASLAQTLRRYTSLNHLAQAARAVLQNSQQIQQMLSDLNRVDFHNVQEQASWVCQCDVELVEKLEEDFKKALQQQNNLEQWADWLRRVVDKILTPHSNSPSNFSNHARQFLLKWSFYSSMVIRDLTLRSAASFGSFHLIRLLYDEYMFYLVEHKVAASLNLSPIAVMSQYLECSKATQLEKQTNSVLNGEEETTIPNFKRPKFEDS